MIILTNLLALYLLRKSWMWFDNNRNSNLEIPMLIAVIVLGIIGGMPIVFGLLNYSFFF
jgi:hypothetical protein